MTLHDWGLSPERIAALSVAELAEYRDAIADYDAAVRESSVAWAPMPGLPHPLTPLSIHAIAQEIRASDARAREGTRDGA